MLDSARRKAPVPVLARWLRGLALRSISQIVTRVAIVKETGTAANPIIRIRVAPPGYMN